PDSRSVDFHFLDIRQIHFESVVRCARIEAQPAALDGERAEAELRVVANAHAGTPDLVPVNGDVRHHQAMVMVDFPASDRRAGIRTGTRIGIYWPRPWPGRRD